MSHYDILKVPINATQRNIYRSFEDLFNFGIAFEEQLDIIDSFIVLSDVNLRKQYDVSIGLDYSNDSPQYLYSYFCNGEDFFDINGNFAGFPELTNFIKSRKNNEIRCSDNVEEYYCEIEIYEKFLNVKRKNIPLEASKYQISNLTDEEKFEIFRKIYNSYKNKFVFSQSFASMMCDEDFNSLSIQDASRRACDKLLNYKMGVCTHFAALMHQELIALGIDAYYARIMLPHWVHHFVVYRIENNWYVCDLTNEYLFGRAGYKVDNQNYHSIKLETFIENNPRFVNVLYFPQYFGQLLTDENVITLKTFLELQCKNESNKL